MKEKIKIQNIVILIISLAILVYAQTPFRNIGYLLGKLTVILPVRIIEGLGISYFIWCFTKKESRKWFSYFSLGFFIMVCLDLVFYLFKTYVISQLPPAF